MAGRNRREVPADLARAQDRLAAWRRTKKPRSRIPEALWEMAVELSGKHGVHRTARTLKLDYYSLKKRAESVAVGHGEEGRAAFVEVPTGLVPVRECVMTFEDGGGTLKLHLKGYNALDIATVGRSLRGSN